MTSSRFASQYHIAFLCLAALFIPAIFLLSGRAFASEGSAATAILPETTDYSAIDCYALAAPDSATQTVASLGAYLGKGAKNDTEKARAIYRWMAENISYDEDGVASGQTQPQPETVLARRVAECGGYANLFAALAKASGMEASVVWGVMKDFDNPDKVVDYPAHSWNAVKLAGQWNLIDTTWAASHVKRGGQVIAVHPFNPIWFCTPPSQFLPSHFPDDAQWQMTALPVTRALFEQMPGQTIAAFWFGIQPVSEMHCSVTTGSSLDLTVSVPAGTKLIAQVRQSGQTVGAQYTFVQRSGDHYVVSAAFPHPGAYDLRLFAKRGAAGGEYPPVMDYAVTASAGANTACFPTVWNSFRDCDAQVAEPSAGTLRVGLAQNFKLAVPGASEVWVVNGGKKVQLGHEGEWFVGPVTLAAGDVSLYSRFADKPETLCGLLKYTAQ